MKTKHLFEDASYVISNRSVAKCFLFGDEKDCERFKSKMDHHLSPICDILAYSLTKDEFKLVVKLKTRAEIESYFKKQFAKFYQESKFIPETTYIFAQAMANLQSGYAKYFNFKYDRDGGLMKGRYLRELIESREHLELRIKEIHRNHALGKRSRIWTFRRKEAGFDLELLGDSVKVNSRRCYEGIGENSGLTCFKRYSELNLRGHFNNLPPKKIIFKNTERKHENVQKSVSLLTLKNE